MVYVKDEKGKTIRFKKSKFAVEQDDYDTRFSPPRKKEKQKDTRRRPFFA